METSLNDVLKLYGFSLPLEINQIYKSAWLIDGEYILKKNSYQKEVEKALMINRFLKAEGIPIAEYITTTSGELSVIFENNTYTLMRKMKGKHIDPFNGDYISTANNIGVEVARLHKALKKLESVADMNKSDLIAELNGWILTEIKDKNIEMPHEIIEPCLDFENSYRLLPRQLIHRDIQFGNMLFEDNRLSGFLDFDISQENVRVFDIIYLAQSMLVGKYNDKHFIEKWKYFTKSLLSGYHSENELLENEIEAIYKITLSIQLIFASFFSSINQSDLVPNCVDMAKWVFLNEEVFTFSLPIA